jgi:hypothetical protein
VAAKGLGLGGIQKLRLAGALPLSTVGSESGYGLRGDGRGPQKRNGQKRNREKETGEEKVGATAEHARVGASQKSRSNKQAVVRPGDREPDQSRHSIGIDARSESTPKQGRTGGGKPARTEW